MIGTLAERMTHWPRVHEALKGYPVRRVWEIFDKMLNDRERLIQGSEYGWTGWGFLMRYGSGSANLSYFINQLISTFAYCAAVYPLPLSTASMPVLDSFSKICAYGSSKYPHLHYGTSIPSGVIDQSMNHPELCYQTADAGGDNEGEFLNQYQLFEKLWNFLHFWGGFWAEDRGAVYCETGRGDRYTRSGFYRSTSYNPGNGARFLYTPQDTLEYKYLVTGYSFHPYSGITQYEGYNILYESDWVQGAFTSPWLSEDQSEEDVDIINLQLFVYPRFPDFYDPDTLEPVYFA